MKSHLLLVAALFVDSLVLAQGTFVYDQQSSADETPFPGAGGVIQQATPPWGQSFTPTNSSIGFIALKTSDHAPGNGLGATLKVNLRTNSIGGPVLAFTDSIFVADNFAGVTYFFLSTPISLSSGTMYYFEPVVQSGDLWNIDSTEYNYPGGSGFNNGLPVGASDLWFREGVVVPEPSSGLLFLIGSGVLIWRRRSRR